MDVQIQLNKSILYIKLDASKALRKYKYMHKYHNVLGTIKVAFLAITLWLLERLLGDITHKQLKFRAQKP